MKTSIPLVPALLLVIVTLLVALVVVRVAFALDSDAARFEAETMSENSSRISVVNDNGTQALRFVNTPTSASQSVSFSANAQMTKIRVRGVDTSDTTRTHPSVRVTVDGAQVLSQQVSGSYSTITAPTTVGAGNHTVSVNMTNRDTGDRIFVDWIAFTYSEPSPPSPSQCPEGEYLATYRNESAAQAFTTQPVLTRCESAPLDHGWGTSSPAAEVNADDFTVLWKGNFNFEAGEYTFSARSDDGIRVYVDGTRILDEWRDQGAADFGTTRTLTAGTHEVRIEYYEHGVDSVAKLSWVKLTAPPPPPPPVPPGFVSRSGEDFALNGARFRFNASAVHRLAEDAPSTIAGKLDQIKAQTGVNTVRADFYQQPNATTIDWTMFDTLLREANARNMKVIVTLENNWGAPTHSNALPPEWYQGGYRSPYGSATLSYLDWIEAVGNRYEDNPAIGYYILVNEPEITGGATNDQKAAIMRDMTREAAATLNAADLNHMITQGVIGTGQGGATSETHYRDLFALPDLDFAYYHDYGNEGQAIPSSLNAHIQTADALGKPIVVGEAGIAAHRCEDTVNTCYTPLERSELFDAKIGAFYGTHGGDGYVPFLWVWDDNGGAWRHSWDYGPNNDPLNAVLKSYF